MYRGDAGSALSCMEFYDCASLWYDDACMEDCFARLCPTGEATFLDLNDCLTANCYEECDPMSGDPDLCDACVYGFCAAEVDACMLDEC